MYQQNRPQMPMPGMMKGVSPLNGLTDGENIAAEEQRMGRPMQPAGQAEEMIRQQQGGGQDMYRMEQFQKMFDEDARARYQEGMQGAQDYYDEQGREKRQQRFDQLVPRNFPGTHQFKSQP